MSGTSAQRRLRANFLSNVLGHGWSFGVFLVSTTVLLRELGATQYGLVGVYLLGQGLSRVLDMGLTPTVNREFARAMEAGDQHRAATMFVTFERVFLALGVLFLIVGGSFAPLVGERWLGDKGIPAPVISGTLFWIVLTLGIQWLTTFYYGVLLGQERQVVFNVARSVEVTLRQLGGAAVAALTGSAEAVFTWMAGSIAVSAVVMRVVCLSGIEARRGARFDAGVLRDCWRFVSGMALVSISGTLISYLDRVAVSVWLPMDRFGLYTLAYQAASTIPTLLIAPIFVAYYPRMCAQATGSDDGELRHTYRSAMQIFGLVSGTATAALVLHGRPLIEIWTGDPEIAAAVAPPLALLALGMLPNALMNAPYALQLAKGNTALPLRLNGVAIAVQALIAVLLIPRFGLVGAAAAWCGSMWAYFAVGVLATQRAFWGRIEPRAVLTDAIRPAALAFAPFALLWWPASWVGSPLAHLLASGVAAALALALGLRTVSGFRELLRLAPAGSPTT